MSEQQWKLAPVEPTVEMQTAAALAIRFETTVLNKLWSGNAAYRAAVDAAPQPPALGGEPVQVLGYAIKDHPYSLRYTLAELDKLTIPFTAAQTIELVDRAHVARLQAEVSDLIEEKQLLTGANNDCIEQIRAFMDERSKLKACTAELEGRLHKATAFVQGLRDAAGRQPSVATGYLQDILDELSSAEGAK